MWLVLGEAADEAAIWAFLSLKHRGLDPIEYILPEELGNGARWSQRLTTHTTDGALTLRDGRILHASEVRGVLNRLVELPRHNVGLLGRDADYVQEELHAFLMSWFFGLSCPVLVPPSAAMLAGEAYSAMEWTGLAWLTGLPVGPLVRSSLKEDSELNAPLYSSEDLRTVFVVGETVLGKNLPMEIAHGSRRLAENAQTPILEVDFSVQASGAWMFVGASPLADLRRGGDALLEALAKELTVNG